MLRRTDSRPDGSGVTLPASLRGARLRVKTLPFVRREKDATRRGLVVRLLGPEHGALGGSCEPQVPSAPFVTQVDSVADRTCPGLVACTARTPGAAERELRGAVGARR